MATVLQESPDVQPDSPPPPWHPDFERWLDTGRWGDDDDDDGGDDDDRWALGPAADSASEPTEADREWWARNALGELDPTPDDPSRLCTDAEMVAMLADMRATYRAMAEFERYRDSDDSPRDAFLGEGGGL